MGFKKGDVVSLKSGGHKMTVKEISKEGVSCIWSKNDNVVERIFEASLLQKNLKDGHCDGVELITTAPGPKLNIAPGED